MSASRLPSGAFHGETTRHAALGDLLLVETRYAPGTRLAPHWHEQAYFCYLLGGTFEERSGSRSRACRAGSLIFHPAGETHADRFGERGGVCVNLEVGPALLKRLAAGGLSLPSEPVQPGGSARRLAGQMSLELQRAGAGADLVVEGLGLALVGEACRLAVARGPGAPPPWMNRALDLLHDRFREPLTLGVVAAELGIHAVHLARSFRRHQGVTVGEYVRSLRIEFACAALGGSRLTIAEIAHASGFADHAHFCRSFRSCLGMSPSRFRALQPPRAGRAVPPPTIL